jgi:taurine dioxygenase
MRRPRPGDTRALLRRRAGDGARDRSGELSGLRAAFSAAKVHGASGDSQRADHPMEMRKNEAPSQARYVHPVVRTHPETGRKSLDLDAPHVERLDGMRVTESEPLIQHLCRHATQPSSRHGSRGPRARSRSRTTGLGRQVSDNWSRTTGLGQLVSDDRVVQRYALNDDPDQRRAMHRVVVQGDVPC